jgi:SAM-dependent methyltransferase
VSAAHGSPNRDREYLLGDQYRDTGKLDVRITLHERFSTNPYGWHRWVFDRLLDLELPADARVLELGCGTAALWRQNGDRIPAGWRITLTDLSPGVLDDAARAIRDLEHDFTTARADAGGLDLDGESFELVVANHMLYHVPNRAGALQAIARVLVPGGRMVAATNGRAHLRELDDVIAAVAPDAPPDDAAEHFGLDNGAAQLAEAFESIEVYRYDDGRRITDADAVLGYVASTAAGPYLTTARPAALLAQVSDVIHRDGAFVVTKDPGLFVSTRS